MLLAKFQNHRTFDSGEEEFQSFFTIYVRGGHLGHLTYTIHTKLRSLCPMEATHEILL